MGYLSWREPFPRIYKMLIKPIERQQKEIQYPGWHKSTTRKGLWSGKDYEVPLGDRDIWGNVEMTGGWWDQQAISSVL